MDPVEYKKLTEQGYFTIRRTNKLWAGIWTDMTIEQILMRSMKTTWDLTRGQELMQSRWILAKQQVSQQPNLLKHCLQLSKFVSSEHHVDLR